MQIRSTLSGGLAFLLTLVACGGSGSGGAPVTPPPTSNIPTVTADLSDFVAETLPYVQSRSEAYVIPGNADLARFDTLLDDLLNRRLMTVASNASAQNFELIRFVDSGAAGNELYCLREMQPSGQGFYCVDFDASDPQHISAPHSLYDISTNRESTMVMRGIDARFLSVSTSHRCANAAATSCSGTTTACGSSAAYRVSDAAHNVDSYFHHFGVAVYNDSSEPLTIQLHGCGSDVCPSNEDSADIVARVSVGTTLDLPQNELVNVLTTALNQRLSPLQLGAAVSCSEPSADKRLCGTTNPLGRYINGQTSPCQNAATTFNSSRWLHVEQNRNLRNDDSAADAVHPGVLVDAINAVTDSGILTKENSRTR